MAIDIGAKSLTGQERTSRVTRLTPVGGGFRLVIERERVFRDDQGSVFARQDVSPVFDLKVEDVMRSVATSTYLAACNVAVSPSELLAAEAAWYDALVAEARAAQGGI